MKMKLILSGLAIYLLACTAASAEVNFDVNIGGPAVVEPAYVAPAYVAPYPVAYDPHHRNRDWRYWRDRRAHDVHARDPHWHR